MKRKILMSVMALAFAAVSAFSLSSNTYADEVEVSFEIKNHEPEVQVLEGIDGRRFEFGEKIPKLAVKYRNAMKLAVKITDKKGSVLKDEAYNVALSSKAQIKEVDTKNLDLKVGAYKVEAKGYNADQIAKEDDAKFEVEMKAPDAPNTGEMKKEQEFVGRNNNWWMLALSITGATIIATFVLVLRRRR